MFQFIQAWTARLMLSVFLMGSFSTNKALASPKKWLKQGQKVSLSLTGEMARFFTASAVVTYWECVSTKDPVKCQIFLRSLEDVHTYAGFMIFVAASRATGFTTYHLTRGRFQGQFLGMAAGLFSSELYHEFREHPKVQELLASRDPERYQALLHELWNDFLSNPEWWEGKVPSLVGLIGGTLAGAMTLPVLSKTIKGARLVLDLSKATQHSSIAAQTAKTLRRTQAWLKFYKLVSAGKISNPALWMTGELGMMILFLKYSEWIEDPAQLWWADHQGFTPLKENFEKFEAKMNWAEFINPSFDLAKAVQEIETSWDDYRSTQILKAKMIQAQYQGELSRLDQQMITPYFYYLWFADRMRADSSVIVENPLGWKPGDPEEIQKYLKSFFCGPTPDQAVTRAQLVWNMPVPGKGQEEVIPYRVTQEDGTCEAFHAPWLSSSSTQDLIFHQKRLDLIRGKKDYAEQVESAQAKIIEIAEPIRHSLVERYQKNLKEVMLTVIDSQEIRDSTPAVHKGIIASYVEEEAYWKKWDQEFGKKTPVFKKALERVRIKQTTVDELKRYLVDFGNFQKQFEEELFMDAFDDDPAMDSVQKWKSFMLINRSAS